MIGRQGLAFFYRGAGVDTYWHRNDARLAGFIPHDQTGNASRTRLMHHIGRGTTYSPYISLTLSYGIAYDYARNAGLNWANPSRPAHVYEIELPDPLPPGLAVLDPVREIARDAPDHMLGNSYHHDGQQTFILGVASPTAMSSYLNRTVVHPPPGQGTPRPASLSIWVEAMVRALRDSEVLAVGAIPRSCITNRYDVS